MKVFAQVFPDPQKVLVKNTFRALWSLQMLSTSRDEVVRRCTTATPAFEGGC